MITKMKKLTLLIYYKEYAAFLEQLRNVGVVHIAQREQGAVEDPELEKRMALANRYMRVIKRLEAVAPEELKPVADVSQAVSVLEKDSGVEYVKL